MTNKGLVRLAMIIAAACSATACATVTRGSSEAWSVETVPSGATVHTNAGYACDATPCTWKLPRKKEFDVTITKPGYKTFHTQVVHQIAGGGAALAGNVILGGLIGIGVDSVTGAALELKPNPLKVTLEPETAAPKP